MKLIRPPPRASFPPAHSRDGEFSFRPPCSACVIGRQIFQLPPPYPARVSGRPSFFLRTPLDGNFFSSFSSFPQPSFSPTSLLSRWWDSLTSTPSEKRGKRHVSCVHTQILEAGNPSSGAINALLYYKGLLCAGHPDGSIRVWDIEGQTAKYAWEVKAHKKQITCVALFEPGDSLLIRYGK
ncbi:hypothetical protein H6P81_017940 [Aristolochia fimbriata]|uniref:Uncharacterized protein n=1 Tax=Aristolochia fimbriata TaxID=158543 RepID=A0AAV7E113_ARIFI|nr:hypothetical protein H6P81_017940 [Aristolochia fimbriata]